MKRAVLVLITVLLLGACAGVGDEPSDEEGTSPVAPAGTMSDPTVPAVPTPGTEQVEGQPEQVGTAPGGDGPGDEEASVAEGNPGETEDPKEGPTRDPAPELPPPTPYQPKYPNTEPVIPPPRD